MKWLWDLLAWFFTETEVVEPDASTVPVIPKHPKMTNREHLYNVAYSCLGIDMAPTQDYVGCAEALSFVLRKSGIKGLPKNGILSTQLLDKWLSENLDRVAEPQFGDVAMFPTGTGNGLIRGHCFVVGKHRWMSNNSNTTLWDDHWEPKKVADYYTKYGGISPRYYRFSGDYDVE